MATATYPSSYPYSSVHTDVDVEKALGDSVEFDGHAHLRAGFVRSGHVVCGPATPSMRLYLGLVLTSVHGLCMPFAQRWTSSSAPSYSTSSESRRAASRLKQLAVDLCLKSHLWPSASSWSASLGMAPPQQQRPLLCAQRQRCCRSYIIPSFSGRSFSANVLLTLFGSPVMFMPAGRCLVSCQHSSCLQWPLPHPSWPMLACAAS